MKWGMIFPILTLIFSLPLIVSVVPLYNAHVVCFSGVCGLYCHCELVMFGVLESKLIADYRRVSDT